ncbi:MAG: hypothetical protein M1385_01090 [Candidatus Marsarchaeota archaeon]|nr:hypothetical protein [Candidatus Marsarchaeota archaeon]
MAPVHSGEVYDMLDISSMLYGIISLGNYVITSSDVSSVGSQFIPIILIAILADSMIISLWYMISSIINSSEWKAGAISEFYQLVGTVIIMVIIVGVLGTYGSAFVSSLGNSGLSPTSMTLTCANLELNSNLNILKLNPTGLTTYSFLSGINGLSFSGLCSYIYAQDIAPSFSSTLNYPLAATGIITANLTNQTATNINSYFVLDSYIGYLKGLSPTYEFCLQGAPGEGLSCLLPPLAFVNPPLLTVVGSYKPYAGFSMLYNIMRTLGVLLTSALESFIGQLLLISTMLEIWPYLLFIGILARVFPYTRKIGGLFIAVAIGVLFFYPLIFSMEYLTIGHGLNSQVNQNSLNVQNVASGITTATGQITTNPITGITNLINNNPLSGPGPIGSAYGTNYSTTNTLTELPAGLDGSIPYNLNFFSEPSLQAIATTNNCWPANGAKYGSLSSELSNTATFLNPITSSISTVLMFLRSTSTLPSGVPSLYLSNACNEQSSENMLFMIMNAYGIIGIPAYWLPIMNLVITLSGIIGLSGLLGGDTLMAGLGNLV